MRKLIRLAVFLFAFTTLAFPAGALAAAPPNDDFDHATKISSLPYSTTVNADGATTAPDDPNTPGRVGSVWYDFTADSKMTLNATATIKGKFISGYYGISVFTGTRGALNFIAGGDEPIFFDTVAGKTYHFMVGGEPGGDCDLCAGTITLSLTRWFGPFPFAKTSPSDKAINQPDHLSLNWTASPRATSYEFCYDTSDDKKCSSEWTSAGSDTSVALTGLTQGITYFWQVRARNADGTTEADDGKWWQLTTLGPPGSFGKTYPSNGITGVASNAYLGWDLSADADEYEYCYDTVDNNTCDVAWTNAGTNTFVGIKDLASLTTYYFQARAKNSLGTTEADNGTWWNFTTGELPGEFGKTNPPDGAVAQSPTLTLTWDVSAKAEAYSYCVDTSDNNQCDSYWSSVATGTSAIPFYLLPNTTYYWQAHAVNLFGETQANGGSWWSFTTGEIQAPATFSKGNPPNNATAQSVNTSLWWGGSPGATNYEYCLDTTNNNVCDASWVSTNGVTVVGGFGPLALNTTYYWQVRATNKVGTTEADNDTWWSFTTKDSLAPGAFNKVAPLNGASGLQRYQYLSWGSSTDATSYEYCYDSTANDKCDSSWVSAGTDSGVPLTSLSVNTTYYWQVRARNAQGTILANNGTWWSFKIQGMPGAFGKTTPTNGAKSQDIPLTLKWETSIDAPDFQYCVDTSNNNICDGTWKYVFNGHSVNLSTLAPGTDYYWQVQAYNSAGTTEANGGTWWSFSTAGPPGPFAKKSPANGSTAQSLTQTLSWAESTHAATYEYCYDTVDNNLCDGNWTSADNNLTVAVNGLSESTTYYWQARSVNPSKTIEADAGNWWSFTTGAAPIAFEKTSPANGSADLPTNPALSWASSNGAASYEYCVNTATACPNINWTTVGTNTNANLNGLAYGQTYYWQVRARNAAGTTEASSGTWWSFATTVPQTIEDNSFDVRYDGWSGEANAAASGGTYHESSTPNDKVTFKFPLAGTGVTWLARKGPDMGIARVSIDDVDKGTVDLYRATTQWQFAKTFKNLKNIKHKIVITVTGTKNSNASGKTVGVDGFRVGSNQYEDTDPRVQYGNWTSKKDAAASGGSYHLSNTKGSVVRLTFTGTQIYWLTARGPGYGIANVVIDGKKLTRNLWAAAPKWQVAISIPAIGAGPHKLEIWVSGNKDSKSSGTTIIVDGFR